MTDQPGRHLTAGVYRYELKENDMTRPKPIQDAVKVVGSGISLLLGVVQTLVTLNVISSEQADQVRELGVAVTSATPILADSTSLIVATVGGLITIATGMLASFGVAKSAESKVTPVDSPRDVDGNVLTPLGPVV